MDKEKQIWVNYAISLKMPIEDIKDLRPAFLDLTQKKLVGFLRAIIMNPPLLVIDEPTMGLKYNIYPKFLKYLKELPNVFSHTLFIGTDNYRFAFRVCDRAILLDKGRVVFDGDQKAFEEYAKTKPQNLTKGLKELLDEVA